MASLYVRNVPDEVYERLRERARRAGRSINAETIEILRGTLGARRDPEELLAAIRENRKRMNWRPGAPTAEEIIRRERDSH